MLGEGGQCWAKGRKGREGSRAASCPTSRDEDAGRREPGLGVLLREEE